jgi:hypothetical protein
MVLALSLAVDNVVFEGLLGVVSVRALPFLSARSVAFATSSMDGAAFKLARLGAIAGCFSYHERWAPNVGNLPPGHVDPTREWKVLLTYSQIL